MNIYIYMHMCTFQTRNYLILNQWSFEVLQRLNLFAIWAAVLTGGPTGGPFFGGTEAAGGLTAP